MKLKSMIFLVLCFPIISIYTIILFDFNNSITSNSSFIPTFHSRLLRPFHRWTIFKKKGGNTLKMENSPKEDEKKERMKDEEMHSKTNEHKVAKSSVSLLYHQFYT